MAVLNLLGIPSQVLDNNGAPLSGGLLYVFEPGSTTPKVTYTTSDLSVPNTHPVVLDAYGRSNAWVSGDCKVVLKTSAGVTLFTIDNANPDGAAAGPYSLKDDNIATKSAAYDVTPADDGRLIVATSGSWTLGTSAAAATFGNGGLFDLLNVGSGTITFNPNGAETVNYGTGAKSSVDIISGGMMRARTDGSNWDAAVVNGYRLRNVRVYTSSDTWTKPDWCRAVYAIAVGAGSAGGGCATTGVGECSCGSGGASGARAEKLITSGLGATETVTVAQGGSGVSGGAGNAPAGDSSFGSHVVADSAGTGGSNTSATSTAVTGTAGGTPGLVANCTGDIKIAGQQGGLGFRFGPSAQGIGGPGAPGPMGGGASVQTGSGNGNAGTNYGSGGGGAANQASQGSQRAGGSGTDGVVVVYEFE